MVRYAQDYQVIKLTLGNLKIAWPLFVGCLGTKNRQRILHH